MLTIYGVYRSRASRVYWMAEELGLDYQSVAVIQARRLADPQAPNVQINTRSPDFLDINPMGQIPSIKDGDIVMHESLAITLYLERKYGTTSGRSVEEDGLISMWTIWVATEVEPHSVEIVRVYDSGMENEDEGRHKLSAAVAKLEAPLAVLNRHLRGRDWVAGRQFSAADLNLAEVLRYAQTERLLFDNNPEIERWIKRCQSRPAYLAMQAKRALESA